MHHECFKYLKKKYFLYLKIHVYDDNSLLFAITPRLYFLRSRAAAGRGGGAGSILNEREKR